MADVQDVLSRGGAGALAVVILTLAGLRLIATLRSMINEHPGRSRGRRQYHVRLPARGIETPAVACVTGAAGADVRPAIAPADPAAGTRARAPGSVRAK